MVMSGLSGNPSTSADGSYTGTVDYGWSGTVTPTKAGYNFSPSSQNYSNVTSNQTQNYTGTLQTFTISGYVRTSGGSGISGVVMSGLSGNPSTAADGSYSGNRGLWLVGDSNANKGWIYLQSVIILIATSPPIRLRIILVRYRPLRSLDM